MYEIIDKQEIAKDIFKYRLNAPYVTHNAKPGQFVVIIPREKGERIPLTIFDVEEENVTVIFQVLGASTKILASLNSGDRVNGILGPLGMPAEIEKFGKVVCVGGGCWNSSSIP